MAATLEPVPFTHTVRDDGLDLTLPAGFKEYEDGKHRRYELLLKVNGAAFAIAALAFKTDTKAFIENVICLSTLALGMALLAIVMAVDIFNFGWRMKQLDPRIKKAGCHSRLDLARLHRTTTVYFGPLAWAFLLP